MLAKQIDAAESRGYGVAGQDQTDMEVQRRSPRHKTKIWALLYKGQSFQTTMIKDVSMHGLGLRGASGIAVGDRINVELLCGRRLEGTVKWWIAGHCGVALSQELKPDDAIFKSQPGRRLMAT